MSRKSRFEYLQEIYERCSEAGKEEKKKILDEFCNVCAAIVVATHQQQKLSLLFVTSLFIRAPTVGLGKAYVYFATPTIFNIKIIPEGYHHNALGNLNEKDSFRFYLHNNDSPFSAIDSAIGVFDSVTFNSTKFLNIPNGIYYIRSVHRSSIETWSKAGGETVTSGRAYIFY